MSAKVCGDPDVIVTDGSASTSALKRTVTTIPVVFVSGDPVGMGWFRTCLGPVAP
jgi:ABC-type uncharacterized transport system substrate-binding protein